MTALLASLAILGILGGVSGLYFAKRERAQRHSDKKTDDYPRVRVAR